eukprot:717798-Karenia_brevis.AAC.1
MSLCSQNAAVALDSLCETGAKESAVAVSSTPRTRISCTDLMLNVSCAWRIENGSSHVSVVANSSKESGFQVIPRLTRWPVKSFSMD